MIKKLLITILCILVFVQGVSYANENLIIEDFSSMDGILKTNNTVIYDDCKLGDNTVITTQGGNAYLDYSIKSANKVTIMWYNMPFSQGLNVYLSKYGIFWRAIPIKDLNLFLPSGWEENVRTFDTENYDKIRIEWKNSNALLGQMVFGEADFGLIDEYKDFSKIYSKTDSFAIESSKPEIFKGEADRLARTANTKQNIVYSGINIKDYELRCYSYALFDEVLDFFASSDGVNFIKIIPTITETPRSRGEPWGELVYSGTLPQSTNFIKIELNKSTVFWTPQILNFKMTADYCKGVLDR